MPDLSDEDDDFIPQDVLDAWPNCPVPDCEHKVCTWAGVGLCHPHSIDRIGRDEVERRYWQTHSRN